MAGENGNDAIVEETTTIEADGNDDATPGGNNDGDGTKNKKDANRKRRMSKKERKNLKKKSKLGVSESSSAATKKERPSKNTSPDASSHETTTTTTTTIASKPTLEEYMTNYVPAPLSKEETTEKKKEEDNSKSLGKWFPKASVVKSSVCYNNDYLAKLAKDKKKLMKQQQQQQQQNDNSDGKSDSNTTATATTIIEPKASLVLFYQYVSPPWTTSQVSTFLTYLTTIAKKHRTNIGGRVRVSTEGINATVSAASTSNPTSTDTNGNNTNNTNNGSNGMSPAFEAAQTLRHFAQDLRNFDPVGFANTDFKYVDDLSADRHFKEFKLIPVKELVFYDIREEDCKESATASSSGKAGKEGSAGKESKEVKGGIHLEAKEYHEMLKRKNTVVIDVRNHYEAAIGRFDGQMEKGATTDKDTEGAAAKDAHDDGAKSDEKEKAKETDDSSERAGAEYIDPKMRKSTDFATWLAEPETKQKLEGKTVMMFCTGGIRCERASAYLNSKMGSDVNGVYQLQGGVERYLQAFPEGGFWRGKNFVFDKREAIGAGNINGDGGVVVKGGDEKKKKKKKKDELLPWGTQCAKCHKPWDRYIGKRKCYTCGVPVLVCDTCMSKSSSTLSTKKKKKKKGQGENAEKDTANENGAEDTRNERVRCPLCLEEGVTVPAEDVEFTDNGIRNKKMTSSAITNPTTTTPTNNESKKKNEYKDKAAKSVLKWGGGHATKKKEKRKFSMRPCQFGKECFRKDCFFYHPERENGKKVKGGGGE